MTATDPLATALAAVRTHRPEAPIEALKAWAAQAGDPRSPLRTIALRVLEHLDARTDGAPALDLGRQIAADRPWVPDLDADFYAAAILALQGSPGEVAGLPVEAMALAYLVILEWLEAGPDA